MPKPALLLFTEDAERMLGGTLADEYEIVRLWQADDPDALIAARGAEVTATLTLRLDASLLDRLPNLQLVVVPGAGYEHIDVAAARARGVTVTNAGDTHSADVADHAVALVLASIHRLLDMHAWVAGGRWSSGSSPGRRHAMSTQRFGLVGLGNIGTAVAERLSAFGGEIAWWGPKTKPAPWPYHETLIDLARWSTVLIVTARGDAAGLIDASTISAVGPEGLIVNVSRGAVIDEHALIAALKGGHLGHAALDVFAEEPTPADHWRDVPNVILTPHVGGVSEEAVSRLREAAICNLRSAIDGTSVVNEIDG